MRHKNGHLTEMQSDFARLFKEGGIGNGEKTLAHVPPVRISPPVQTDRLSSLSGDGKKRALTGGGGVGRCWE